ncbi:hypothetical protein IAU60_006135 [Kwoniella sp. DSM 27419]
MESVNIPTDNVPEGLKGCEQILRRAKEIKKVEPVVAYWCCFSAAQKALNVKQRTKEETLFLMSVIDALEQMKVVLANNEAITSEAAGAALVEAFALKVFMNADNNDRAGNTGKATIRGFVAAGQFIEVLKCFENGMTDEMEQKLAYARWKAADGARALREGRTPMSGPPGGEEEIETNPFPTIPGEAPSDPPRERSSPPSGPSRSSFSSFNRPMVPQNPSSGSSPPTASPARSPRGLERPNLPAIRTSSDNQRTPTRGQSGAWSTVATPGIAEDGSEPSFDLAKSSVILPSAPPMSPPKGDDTGSPGEKKNVRFMGPDGAPLSPASTHITVDSYAAPPAPPPTEPGSPKTEPKVTPPSPPSTSRPRVDGSSPASPPINGAAPPSGGRPRGDSGSTATSIPRGALPSASHPQDHRPPASASITVPPPPPPSLASHPIQPPTHPQPHGLGLSSPALARLSENETMGSGPGPTKNLNRREVEQTQKHAKWAISALEFDDFETARNELRKALNMLGG